MPIRPSLSLSLFVLHIYNIVVQIKTSVYISLSPRISQAVFLGPWHSLHQQRRDHLLHLLLRNNIFIQSFRLLISAIIDAVKEVSKWGLNLSYSKRK